MNSTELSKEDRYQDKARHRLKAAVIGFPYVHHRNGNGHHYPDHIYTYRLLRLLYQTFPKI